MNNKNKISVIVPVYNLQGYIERSVKSILGQTHKEIEIILVDDGSSDNSRQIIEKIAETDERIVPVYKKNGGVTSARLAGLRKASGEWIGFVDGDDEIEPDMYELLLKNAIQYQVDISHCGYQMIFRDGRIHYFYGTKCLEIYDRITGLRELLDGSKIEPGLWNKLFRRTLFDPILKKNIIDQEIKINEDLLMNYYLFSEAENSVFYDVCKYHYLVRNESVSRQKLNKKKIFDPICVKKIILSRCPGELKKDAEKALLSTCVYSYCTLVLAGPAYQEEMAKVRDLIRKYYRPKGILSKRTKILAILIIKMPYIFSILYILYAKYIQKKVYE